MRLYTARQQLSGPGGDALRKANRANEKRIYLGSVRQMRQTGRRLGSGDARPSCYSTRVSYLSRSISDG